MSEQKPTMQEIHSILLEAWAYFDRCNAWDDNGYGSPRSSAEFRLADKLDDMITRLEQMEEVNV